MAQLLPVKVVAPVPIFDYAAVGHKHTFTPAKRDDGDLEVFYPRWFYPPGGGSINSVLMAARLTPFLRRLQASYRFNVLDAHFGYPSGIAAALIGSALKVPFTITLRGNETMHAHSPLLRRWMQWSFRRASRLITVSGDLREFAISMGADASKIQVVPNGIDIELFYPRDYLQTRRLLGIPQDCPVILSAGYLIERKGHHRIIRALSELRRQGSRAQLWIVGGLGREGRFEAQLREEVSSRGLGEAVHFTGAVKPSVLADYMSAADLFCLASSREGWPNVVHEALGCGLPAVATNVGGVRDMLASPDYGIVVSPGDQGALTAALGNALDRRWNREQIAAWGRARSWSRVASEAAAVLRDAAADARDNGPARSITEAPEADRRRSSRVKPNKRY